MAVSPPSTRPHTSTEDPPEDRASEGRRSGYQTPRDSVIMRVKRVYGAGSRGTIVRRCGALGPLVSLLGVILVVVLKHSATGVSLFWVGTAGFFFTNYAADRRSEPWIVGPAVAACATLGALALVLVSVIAGVAS